MVAHRVGISIVNYKTAQLVEECLVSLLTLQSDEVYLEVCIVDNASADGSFERLNSFSLLAEYGQWVTVIAAERNGGFSYGNNVAARYFESKSIDYFWLLNPDAAPLSGSLNALIDMLMARSDVAIVGSRLEDEDGTPQIAAFNYPSILGEFVNTLKLNWLSSRCQNKIIAKKLPQTPLVVDWVAGASMLVRWSSLKSVGFMDEDYFLYFEEVDLCLAILRDGGKTMYVPSSRVIHHVGAATGISDTRKQSPRRPTYWFDSRRRFFQKNFGFLRALAADIFWVTGYSLYRIKAFLTRKTLLDPPFFLRDFLRNSTLMKGHTDK